MKNTLLITFLFLGTLALFGCETDFPGTEIDTSHYIYAKDMNTDLCYVYKDYGRKSSISIVPCDRTCALEKIRCKEILIGGLDQPTKPETEAQ